MNFKKKEMNILILNYLEFDKIIWKLLIKII